MADLIFNPENHTYTVGGVIFPSVTQVLRSGGIVKGTDWFTEGGRNVGEAVHKAIALDLRDDLDWETLHPMIAIFLRQWADFRAKTGLKFDLALCEVPQYHPGLRYAGTPDIVGTLNGRPVLIDLKCGSSSAVGPQLAAYAALPEIGKLAPTRFCLSLKGKFKLQRYSDSRDFLVFLDALHKFQDNQKGETHVQHIPA